MPWWAGGGFQSRQQSRQYSIFLIPLHQGQPQISGGEDSLGLVKLKQVIVGF